MSAKGVARLRRHLGGLVVALSLLSVGPVSAGQVEASMPGEFRIQGSTTFHARLLQPNIGQLEAEAGAKLSVIPNKSIWGLIALLEGRADLAMISASLAGEIEAVRRAVPDLSVDNLQEYEISRTRIVFAIHPSNPVRELDLEKVAAILSGQILNWREVGGPDLPIRVVATQDGGGTVVAVRSQVLGGRPIVAPDAIRLESATHVIKVVEQMPGAIGIAQLGLAQEAGLPELATERAVEQRLSLVTHGPPSAIAQRLIEAARQIAGRSQM